MATSLQRLLSRLDACQDARRWAEGRDLTTAWRECERADWMLWLCAKMEGTKGWPDEKTFVLAVCACAETSFRYLPVDEQRPQQAIAIARAWAAGAATIEQVRAAWAAAWAAGAAAWAARAAAWAAWAAGAAGAAGAAMKKKIIDYGIGLLEGK